MASFFLDKYQSRIKPKHKGIVIFRASQSNVNAVVVKLLLDLYPDSIKANATAGRLPLHTAAGHNPNTNVIKLQLDRYPDSIKA